MIKATQNFFDSTFRVVVDSEYGIGALHSIPMRILGGLRYIGFDTRPGKMVTFLLSSKLKLRARGDG